MDRLLVLCRHGQSTWNAADKFTGWEDPDLTDLGVAEARQAGQKLKARGITFDRAFTSALSRAQRTCQLILDEIGQPDLQSVREGSLNERHYGSFTGLNKAETRAKMGEAFVYVLRRSYRYMPPGGESLEMTAIRVNLYYRQTIEPLVLAGQRVLVAAHGNSLRALIMEIEGLSGDEIAKRELATGAPIVYRLNADGSVADRIDL
jgi:2,3-bisphosphoglycerate-dependent phosphoglycerate mutase